MKYVPIVFLALLAFPFIIVTAAIFSSNEPTARHAGSLLNEFPGTGRNIGQEPFSAITDCPKCGTIALHHIKDMLTFSCRRECVDCNYVWRQI